MNSVIVTLCVTAGRVFRDSLAGYALARPHFRGRAGLSALFIGIMAVPAEVLLIPRYLVLVQLGIYNTYAGMIIPRQELPPWSAASWGREPNPVEDGRRAPDDHPGRPGVLRLPAALRPRRERW